MKKIGSEANPIRLLPDIAKRTYFEEATGIGRDVGIVVDMSRMKPPKLAFQLYIKNLITNPCLSANEMRLGYLLYDTFENDYTEATFLVVPMSEFHMSKVGEDGLLYITASRSVPEGFDYLEKQSLLEKTKSWRLNISTGELIKSLNKLHSFFYITCTEISEENLAENRIGFKYKKNEILLSEQTEMVHIRLNDRFDKIDLTNRWSVS